MSPPHHHMLLRVWKRGLGVSHRTPLRRSRVAESHGTLGEWKQRHPKALGPHPERVHSRAVFSQVFNKHHAPHYTYWLDKHLLGTCHVQALCQPLSIISAGPCPSGTCSLTKGRVQEQQQAGQEADVGHMEEMWKVVPAAVGSGMRGKGSAGPGIVECHLGPGGSPADRCPHWQPRRRTSQEHPERK